MYSVGHGYFSEAALQNLSISYHRDQHFHLSFPTHLFYKHCSCQIHFCGSNCVIVFYLHHSFQFVLLGSCAAYVGVEALQLGYQSHYLLGRDLLSYFLKVLCFFRGKIKKLKATRVFNYVYIKLKQQYHIYKMHRDTRIGTDLCSFNLLLQSSCEYCICCATPTVNTVFSVVAGRSFLQ